MKNARGRADVVTQNVRLSATPAAGSLANTMNQGSTGGRSSADNLPELLDQGKSTKRHTDTIHPRSLKSLMDQ